jgi:hypothetical protein
VATSGHHHAVIEKERFTAFHEPRGKVSIRKPALTPALSAEEREKQLPGLGKMMAPDRHWFKVATCIP